MRLDPIGQLFANAWQRLQERFMVVAAIFLVPLVLIGIGRALIYQHAIGAIALGGILNAVGGTVSIFASIAIISAFGKGTDFGASYGTSVKLFWAWVWVGILAVLAVIGGYVMLIIPGIMLAVQLVFATYAVVLEDRRGLAALAQSREYLKGYWWAFFGRSLLLVLCLVAAMLVFYAPSIFILGPIGSTIVYCIILLIFTPFATAYQYEVYENLRRLKPEVADGSMVAKGEHGFLKVAIVVGIVGAIAFVVLFCVAIFFLPAAMVKWQAGYPGGYNNNSGYGYPSPMGTSTAAGSIDLPTGGSQ